MSTSFAPPFKLQSASVQQLLADTNAREALLAQIVAQFERKYGISLEELEKRLEHGNYSEHPAWEDSIEWRNAVEQRERVQLTRSILNWLSNLLAQSASS